ncbi:hypothetical protein KCU62_g8597, partial [Aureobasidium sp. EXF-3399]
MRHITTNLGLYDQRVASRVYDPLNPRTTRARAVLAWGMHHWAISAEFAFRTSLGFENVPPVPPPRPRAGRTLKALRDKVFVTQAGLSSIMKHIVPLQREHSKGPLTLPYLTAALGLYEQLRTWWMSIDPALRSLQVIEEAPPHVFMVTCMYHFAVGDLFRPFITTSTRPTPHAAPLIEAGLPIEPCLSAAVDATRQSRTLHRCIAKLYSYDQFMGFLPYYAFPVAFETLPSTSSLSLTFSWDAASAFLADLRILAHASKQLPAVPLATLGIEKAASNMNIVLPDEAKQIFDWVVVFNTANSNVQASRLNTLAKELQNLGLSN